MARLVALVCALLLLTAARVGHADDTAQAAQPRRVVMLEFSGKQSKAARSSLSDGLAAAGYDVVPKSDAFAGGEPKSAEQYVALAARLRLSAFIAGKLQKVRAGYKLELSVRNGADGEVLDPVSVQAPTLKKLRAQLSEALPQELASTLENTAAPPEPEAKPEKPEKPEEPAKPAQPEPAPAATAAPDVEADDETAAAEPGGEPTYSLIELALGLRGYSRDLTYNDDLFDKLPVFQLGAAPAALVSLRLYPLARSSRGFLRHVGVDGSFEYGFATSVTDVRDRELDVTTRQFHVGLRGRFPFATHELGLSAGYGQHHVAVEEPSPPALVPDVDYEFLRVSLDARFAMSDFLFGFHGGYRLLLSTGEFETEQWFPRATGAGVEAGAFVGQKLSQNFALYGGFDLLRYFFSLNPEPDDTNIAGGALDQYLSLWAAVAWVWP
jgi:hypothetical protein